MVDQLVKRRGCDIFHESRRLILRADHADHLIPLVKLFYDLRQALRRMLQVRVHADDTIAFRIIQPCDHRRLMPEVSGKVHDLYFFVGRREFLKDRQGLIPAAVVHEQKLVVPVLRQRFQDLPGLHIKFS